MDKHEVTFVNLKVLAKLEPYQKLNTRRTHFQISTPAISNSYVALPEFVLRWWAGSNRENDYIRLKELYFAAIDILKTNEKKEQIRAAIVESKKGLESLQKTYENDVTTKAKIDWLLDHVNTQTKDISDN
jgi:hypothetical protein